MKAYTWLACVRVKSLEVDVGVMRTPQQGDDLREQRRALVGRLAWNIRDNARSGNSPSDLQRAHSQLWHGAADAIEALIRDEVAARVSRAIALALREGL